MEAGTLTDGYNPWGVAMFDTLKTVEPHSASEQAAYSKWLDQRTDRESARADRTHGAEGVIPTPLWIVLVLSAAMIFIFTVAIMIFTVWQQRRAEKLATVRPETAAIA